MDNMGTNKEIELRNFFIFNSFYGPKEGEELKKILFYYPIADNADIQIKNVGLVEGIIQFTGTFKPNQQVNSLHTEKMRQLYFEPEKNFWMVITLNLPTIMNSKDENIEYLDDDLQDNVFEAILKLSYKMYRLLNGTFESTIENKNVGPLKTKLEHFYKSYIPSLNVAHSDILNVFSGIQYLPLDKLTFLKVQCFINSLESNYSEVEHSAFLYNDHLIWSGLEPSDMKVVYGFLVKKLLPTNAETELRSSISSPFAALQHGRFITGPSNLKTAQNPGKIPKVHLFRSSETENITSHYLLVYKLLNSTVCLFLKADSEPSLDFLKDLDEYTSPKLSKIVSEVSEYCAKVAVPPSNIVDNTPRFIYFNQLNLAYKSTVHLDNKKPETIACSKESVKIIADLAKKHALLGETSETIVKTMNDYWVVAKTSNSREFYIVLQQKNASLVDISDEVRKLCDSELKGIFFHPK